MIHHDWDLFYDSYNTINEYKQRQTNYFSLTPNYFDYVFLSDLKSSITSSASSLI